MPENPFKILKPSDREAEPAVAATPEELFRQRVEGEMAGLATQNEDGAWLAARHIHDLFQTELNKRGFPGEVIYKLWKREIEPLNQEISEKLNAAEVKNREEMDRLHQERDAAIVSIIRSPEKFGVDVEDFSKSRNELELPVDVLQERIAGIKMNDQGAFNAEIFEIFDKSGRLMTAEKIKRVSESLLRELFVKMYGEAAADEGVTVFISKCLYPLVDKIKEYEPNRNDPASDRRFKLEQRDLAIAAIGAFLADIVNNGNVEAYVQLLNDGVTEKQRYVVLPALELRIPYKILKNKPENDAEPEAQQEYKRMVRNGYKEIIRRYSPEKWDSLRSGLNERNAQTVFFDEAGRKQMAHFTEEINTLLREVEFEEDNIRDAYAADLGGILQEMSAQYDPLREAKRGLRAAQREARKADADPKFREQIPQLTDEIRKREANLNKLDKKFLEEVAKRVEQPIAYKFRDIDKAKEVPLLASYAGD